MNSSSLSSEFGLDPRPTNSGPKARPLRGEPTLRLNLSEAIRQALEQNLAIQVDAFNPKIADSQILVQEGVFDPTLRAGAGYAEDGVDAAQTRSGTFGAGLDVPNPWGGVYRFDLTAASADTSSTRNSYTSGAAISLNQPLLRGFGTAVTFANLRIARNDRRIDEWAFRQTVIDVVTRTVRVYNALYASLRDFDAAVRSRDAALQLQHDEERRAELGVKTALDVTTARAEAASRQEAVLLARQNIRENERFLKQLVTADTDTLLNTRVSITPPPTPATGPLDPEDGVRDALRARPDYRQARIALDSNRIKVAVARNGTLPRVDLTASLGLNGISSPDFWESFQSVGNFNRQPGSWGAGLTFSLPIPNRSARGKLTGARLRDAQALVDLQRMEQAIVVSVANAADEAGTAKQRIDTTREALRLARESLDAGGERLKAGVATTFEVLELQRKLAQAEASEIKAEADYRNALAEYDRQTGMTLERNGIAVAP